MAKTELCLQTKTETSQVEAPASDGCEKVSILLRNVEATQKHLSASVASCISNASYDLVPLEERSATTKDVIQNSWVKILNSPEREITSLTGYLFYIARAESIDEIRRRKRKRTLPLPLNQDGELSKGQVLLTVHVGMRDPSIEYDLKEWITEVVDAVVQLPQKQVYAMVCAMKDEVGDPFLLAELFNAHGIDIDPICWPQNPKELQSLRSLLSVARKTLREKFNRVARQNKRSKHTGEEKKEGHLTSVIVSASGGGHQDRKT